MIFSLFRSLKDPLTASSNIALAMADMGVVESSHNRGKMVDVFNLIAGKDPKNRYAWCAIFCEAVLMMGGWAHRKKLDTYISGGVAKTWNRNWEERPENMIRYDSFDLSLKVGSDLNGWVFCRTRIEKDVDLVAKDRSNKPGHMGMAIGKVKMDTNECLFVRTVEGNTDGEGDSAEGDGVYSKRLYLSNPLLIGFIKPTYR
jgi:hypothetical protein